MKDDITERKDYFFYWKKETYCRKKAKTKTNNADPVKKNGAIVMTVVTDQVIDLLKKALTQQTEELPKKFPQIDQKMTRDSVVPISVLLESRDKE
jgi:hypothetical protein